MFIVDKTTKDDLYILISALRSGNNCKILSNDYLRQHFYTIGLSEN